MSILFKPAALKSSVLYILLSAALSLVIIDYAKDSVNTFGTWLLSVNAVLIAAMAKDKLSAMINFGRTPEGTLLWLALSGAFPGLFAARFLFNHKTTKPEFVRPMWFLLSLQIVGVFYYIIILNPIVK